MTNKEYLDAFEAKLINELLNLCKSYNTLDNILLATEDINQRWDAIAPEYMADSVKEIADYPTVAVAWAAYLGMAVAREWDNVQNPFKDLRLYAVHLHIYILDLKPQKLIAHTPAHKI